MINRRVANIIAILIAGVWVLSFLVSAIPGSTYKTDPLIHSVMLIVAGAIFGSGLKNGGKE